MCFAAFLAAKEDHGEIPISMRFGNLGVRQLPALFGLEELSSYPPKEPLISDSWLPDLQVMASRSVPGSSAGLYVAAKGGHNDESHNHNDVGNFIVYLDGMPVIIDVGVETYTAKTFSNQRYDIWTMQFAYHSLPTVNGMMQHAGREYATTAATFSSDKKSSSLTLDIAGAYPEEASLESLRRSISLKRNKEVMVSDDYSFTGENNSIILNLMTDFHVTDAPGSGKIMLSNTAEDKHLLIHYDEQYTSVETELIKIDDGRLKSVRGNELIRIRLHANISSHSGTLIIRFSEE